MIALVETFESQLPALLLHEDSGPTTFVIQRNGLLSSLAICLSQEMVKFNRLEYYSQINTDILKRLIFMIELQHFNLSFSSQFLICFVFSFLILIFYLQNWNFSNVSFSYIASYYHVTFVSRFSPFYFDRLLSTMEISLRDISRAIKGTIVMSSDLDSMHSAFLNNQVYQDNSFVMLAYVYVCVCTGQRRKIYFSSTSLVL